MKVLHVVTSLDPKSGGVSQAVKSIVYGLEELGVDSEVVTFDANSDYSASERFVAFNLGPATTSWRYAPKFTDWLREHLESYTHVILHGLWQYHTFAFFRAIKERTVQDLKILVMPHGMLDPWFQRADNRRLKAVRNYFYWLVAEKNSISQANGMLFTSEQELLKSRTTFPNYRPREELNVGLGVIPPPPLTADMIRSFNRIDPRFAATPYLLYMARIDKKKGIDLLISAYLTLREKGHALPLLVVAGPGLESDFGAEVLALANNNADIIFTGMLSGDTKWGAFYGCSAFVLPSHQENFGIAVVEALACHKPVLLTDQVDIYGEIKKTGGGLVSDDTAGGIEGLLLAWLALSEAEKKEMSANARFTYESYFTPEKASCRLKEALL